MAQHSFRERDFKVEVVGGEGQWFRPKSLSLFSSLRPLAVAGGLGGLVYAVHRCTQAHDLQVTNLIGLVVTDIALTTIVLWALRKPNHAEDSQIGSDEAFDLGYDGAGEEQPAEAA